jgi:methylglutaconyl-CoA hydratase
MIKNGYVLSERIEHKLYISFYHPKSNSLPSNLLNELAEKINKASDDDNVNVIIIKSEGEKVFCAGASFDELLSIDNLESGKKFFMGFANVLNAIRKCKKFVIARVQGKVVGGGVGLVAACDYSMAVKDSSVKLSELAIGIGPFVIAPAIERKVGKETLSAMTINFDWRDAEWALSKGLFDDVYNSIPQLDDAIEALADKLNNTNPDAVVELKKMFWEGTDHWETLLEERAEISGRLVLSEHTKKYIERIKAN